MLNDDRKKYKQRNKMNRQKERYTKEKQIKTG